MKRKVVAFLVVAALSLPMGGIARADAQPCNLKAIAHTAEHLMKATDPGRIRRLWVRYERLRNRCFVVPPHV
jgi:uncharacterized protein YmfQ (DUF2313 family)